MYGATRRFPPPPGGAGARPSTPPAESRSTESPMEYQDEHGQDLSGTAFGRAMHDGEPERKRIHYEEPTPMQLDTPTKPPNQPDLDGLPPSSVTQLDLGFDAHSFSATHALGLHPAQPQPDTRERSPQPASSNNFSVALVDGFDDDHSRASLGLGHPTGPPGGPRRRVGSNQRKRDFEDDDEDEAEDEDVGQLSRMATKLGGRKFSFQVHHHHPPTGPASGGVEGAKEEAKRWLHSGTPYVLLGYLQFSSLLLLSLFLLALIVLLLHTLYHDVQQRLASLTLQLRGTILACAKSYVDNRCQPESRLPAMERQCALWEECMAQEPVVEGRTRIVAETVAEVVNGFVEVISLRTMLFVSLTLVLTIYGSSVALSLLPSRNVHAQPPPSPYGIGPPHLQHLGAVPPAYYALSPQGYPPQVQGSGWAVGPPGGGSPALGGPKGDAKGAKKGWF